MSRIDRGIDSCPDSTRELALVPFLTAKNTKYATEQCGALFCSAFRFAACFTLEGRVNTAGF
jgi:hypothetical protein